MEKLKRMKDTIKIWNKEVFGDTKEIKRRSLRRYNGWTRKRKRIVLKRKR